jgi:putative superfamily III holin-X
MSQAITRVETGVSSMAIGGVVAFGGFLVLLAAAVLGLDLVVHALWLSTLIVGGLVLVVGAGLLFAGKSRLTHLAPERSLHSLRRDTELVQEHLPGGGS